jgi:hypothetical protein
MKFHLGALRLPAIWILIGIFVLLILASWKLLDHNDSWQMALSSGLVTGLTILTVQVLLEYKTFKKLDQIEKMGVIDIKATRDTKDYYKNIIDRAQSELMILGVTASRFMEDFAHPEREDSQALIKCLRRHVSVKVLLPSRDNLPASDHQKLEETIARIRELRTNFSNIELRLFASKPTHSIVATEKECMVGPVFPNLQSRDSPAIHAAADSAYVVAYIRHFREVWEAANQDAT